ncbi:unnamed protein product [Leptidea sinapis]|uniref:Lipase domain-containing protein n=1 Tax=Leptidea sinapis TaxID=189913 RepID=A0A5E4PQ69_9NEOP|nr:unnamed protein product [Leptidea sinapis]
MGKRLADFIQFLDTAGVPAGSVYVIGFSLGAEAAGFAGKELQRRGLKLGRITDGCSHNRAWRLYAESLQNPSGFPATLCMDWRNDSRKAVFNY